MKRLMWAGVAALVAACGGGEPAQEAPAEEAAAQQEEMAAAFDAQASYNTVCASCHGTAGDGAGPAGAALNPPPANFTDPAFWESRTDETIFTAIKEGGPAVGRSPLMVGWAAQFDDDQIHALVEYVKTFKPAG